MIDLFDIGLPRRVCLIEGFVANSPVTCISRKLSQEILTPLCRPSVSGPRARLCRSSAASCLCMTAVTSCCKLSVRIKLLLWLERQAQERPRRYSHTVCHHLHVTSFLSTSSSLQFNTAAYLFMKHRTQAPLTHATCTTTRSLAIQGARTNHLQVVCLFNAS